MRPRVESMSSPSTRYVGPWGRQMPQWTQARIPSMSGGSLRSKAPSRPAACVSDPIDIASGVQRPQRIELALQALHEGQGFRLDGAPDVQPLFDLAGRALHDDAASRRGDARSQGADDAALPLGGRKGARQGDVENAVAGLSQDSGDDPDARREMLDLAAEGRGLRRRRGDLQHPL